MERKSLFFTAAVAASITALISIAVAQNSTAVIPTFEPAHAVGSTCVMLYRDSKLAPLARVYIEESKQEFIVERVQNLFNFREARAAYDVAKGLERCTRARNDRGRKRGFNL